MKYNNVGNTGLKVSKIYLGTMTFEIQVNEADSIKLVKNALDAGVNFLDCAPVYANTVSEEIVGKAIKGNRNSSVILTKVKLFL